MSVEIGRNQPVPKGFLKETAKEFWALRSLGLVILGVVLCKENVFIGSVVTLSSLPAMIRDIKLIEQGKL